MDWSSFVWRASLFVFIVVLLTACATTPPENAPLPPERRAFPTGTSAASDYRFATLAQSDPSPELFVSLSFSGGGKRSAAFSYGVLQGLRELKMANGSAMLDAVDFISGVSGGAFTAASYGLHRERLFETYTQEFLYDDTEAYIWGTYLLPWKWGWIFSGSFGTNDAMAEVYDDQLFHGATYADLLAKGRPLIAVNATDVTYGSPFPFIQDQFDLICSDLNTYPLARAVAASNGLPVLFTPITLKNYSENCGGRRPEWLTTWLKEPEVTREHEAARVAERYIDYRQTQYVHLLDGGISDNLAMRPVIGSIIRFNDDARRFAHGWAIHTRRVLLVSVDGQAAADTAWARQRTVSGIGQIIAAVTGSQIDEYNFETLLLAKEQMARLVEELKGLRCRHADEIESEDCKDVSGEVVHLSLARIKDEAIRTRLQAIPTGLTLSKEDVDLLVQSGRQVALESAELKAFVQHATRRAKGKSKPQS
jgi:NTE family protein